MPLLCVEANRSTDLRAYANVREDANIPLTLTFSLVAPDGNGRFVLTIAPEEGQMYQGIVSPHAGRRLFPLADYLTTCNKRRPVCGLRQTVMPRSDAAGAATGPAMKPRNDSAWDAVVRQG